MKQHLLLVPKHGKHHPPAWSRLELAAHLGITATLLARRLNEDPTAPQPVMHTTRLGRRVELYDPRKVVAWYRTVQAEGARHGS